MGVYWRKVKRGENLILSDENDGHEEELGGFRDTKRGIDASAKTFSYDPSRSRKGFPSIEEAKDFVESFRPWELFGTQGVTVDPGVRPALDSATTDTPDTAGTPDTRARQTQRARQTSRRSRWWRTCDQREDGGNSGGRVRRSMTLPPETPASRCHLALV